MSIDGVSAIEQGSNIAKIGTDTLVPYLTGHDFHVNLELRGDWDDFEKEMQIPSEITQAISQVYSEKQMATGVGVRSAARRNDVLRVLNATLPDLGGDVSEALSSEGEAEQARMIFVDARTGDLKSTSSEFGLNGEVSMWRPLQEVFKQSGIPIVGIHTHDRDTPFSMQDYTFLLMGIPQEKVRFLSAQLVLLPEMQLLAIGTKDTPILGSAQDADDFVQDRVNKNHSKEMGLMEETLSEWGSLLNRRKIAQVVSSLKDTDNVELRAAATKIADDNGFVEDEEKIIQERMDILMSEARLKNAVDTSNALIGFARELHIKLYSSKDGKTFKEFSA